MKKVKLVALKDVNIRTLQPKISHDNLKGIIYKGVELELTIDEETPILGGLCEEGNPNNIWYKDGNGDYLWSGGFELVTNHEPANKNRIDYNAELILSQNNLKINETKGENVIIAILDTGCNDHQSLNGKIIYSYNAILKTENSNCEDNSFSGHGTFIAGLIASDGEDSEIQGIAPKSKLIIIKIADDDNSVYRENVLEALIWLTTKCPLKPDLINLSFDFFPGIDAKKSEFTKLFDKLRKANQFCIAAGQNNKGLQNSLFYPSTDENTIAVGALNKNAIDKNNPITFNPKLLYIVPDIEYYSTGKSVISPYIKNNGCSFSAAIITGTLSLIISYKKATSNNEDIFEYFNKNIQKYDPTTFVQELKIYRV